MFAHFRSKERLQQEAVEAASGVCEREVLVPGLAAPGGLAQVEGLCEAYLSYVERGVFPGGCFFAQLLADYDARTGPLHDRLFEDQRGLPRHVLRRPWAGRGARQHRERGATDDPPVTAPQLI